MMSEDLQPNQQIGSAQERLSILHRAVSDAIDKLARFCNTVDTTERLYFRDTVDVKVGHIREVRQVAKDLALAANRTKAPFENAELS